MYLDLSCNGIDLEYIGNIMTVFYKDKSFTLKDHNILNIIKVINNLFPGVNIKGFNHEDLTVNQNDEGILINNKFFIEDDKIPDLITILNQAHNLMTGIFTAKVDPPKKSETVDVKVV